MGWKKRGLKQVVDVFSGKPFLLPLCIIFLLLLNIVIGRFDRFSSPSFFAKLFRSLYYGSNFVFLLSPFGSF